MCLMQPFISQPVVFALLPAFSGIERGIAF
jgi:hypothetical protein